LIKQRFWLEFGVYQAVAVLLYIMVAIIFIGGLQYYSVTSVNLSREDLVVMGVVSWLATLLTTVLVYFAFQKGIIKTNPSKLD